MMSVMGFFWGIIWVGCVIGSALLAGQKNRSVALAILGSFFFGIFVLVYYIAVKPVGEPKVLKGKDFIAQITGRKTTEEKLVELKRLFEQKILTEEEYKKAKERVIEKI